MLRESEDEEETDGEKLDRFATLCPSLAPKLKQMPAAVPC